VALVGNMVYQITQLENGYDFNLYNMPCNVSGNIRPFEGLFSGSSPGGADCYHIYRRSIWQIIQY